MSNSNPILTTNPAPGFEIKVLDYGFVRYVDHLGSDLRIVEAARVSYKSPSKGDAEDKKLLTYLWKNRHTSPFEMAKVTLNIKMPIFVARQYVRHRMQNLNEQSARYTQLPAEFYIPDKWRAQDTKNKQGSVLMVEWGEVKDFYMQGNFGMGNECQQTTHQLFSKILLEHCERCYKLYEWYLEKGAAREMARMVLPLNIYTEFYCCWDIKNLLHFVSLREDKHAQWEHQQYGIAIKKILQLLFPWTMEAYERWRPVMVDHGPVGGESEKEG